MDPEDYQEHTDVLNEALKLYEQREQKYHGLWKEVGASDNSTLAKHKIERVKMATNGGVTPEDYIDDALDVINYAVFWIRNVRAGRLG